jgi:hypothetical protein
VGVVLALGLLSMAPGAHADELTFEAGRLTGHVRAGELTLRDNVVLRQGRYRIESDALTAVLEPDAVTLRGEGRVALCPCADPPLAFRFDGARLDRAGDLIVGSPRVQLFGQTVLWLPALWLRAEDRVALLPPRVAWRGEDGLLLGAGVRLPWRTETRELQAIEILAGGYTAGGVELDARFVTPRLASRLVWDEVRGRRVVAQAVGSVDVDERAGVAVAARVDALRGDRAQRGTIDLGAASMPFDHAAVETSLRLGQAGRASTGFVAEAARGLGPIALGPSAWLGVGGALDPRSTWEANAGVLVLRDPLEGGAQPLARGAVATEVTRELGVVDLRLGTSNGARVAALSSGERAIDAVTSGQLALSLPMARGWGRLMHLVAPVVAGRVALALEQGQLFDALRAPMPSRSGLVEGGLDTRLNGSSTTAMSATLRGGWLAEEAAVGPTARAELGLDARMVAWEIEAAAVGLGPATFALDAPRDGARPDGFAVRSLARLGDAAGLTLLVDGILQTGAGAAQARSLALGDAASLPTDRTPMLRGPAATGGAELAIPWPHHLRTTLRGDADLGALALLALRATLGYEDPCGCLALALTGAHRAGRGGVDVWANVELAPSF